ncbi:MAG: ATP synthase F1 subunit delta [Proteobacteria bacterium]|nr:ATP synthase F1 subunit delta [Pseudomonadota bacterium]
MSRNLIAGRYAKALIQAAGQNDELTNKLSLFLESVAGLFDFPEAKKILKSPVMPLDLKRSLLRLVSERTSAGVEAERFSDEILIAGRVGLLPEINSEFRRLLDEKNGFAQGTLTTASMITENTKSEFQKLLSKLFKKNLTLESNVDQNILGGVIIKVGNYTVDLSVKTKLDSLVEQAIC